MISDALRRRALDPERFVVLLRKDHPAAKKKLDLARYLALGHVLVAPGGLPGGIVDAALAKLGHERRVVARVQHFLSAPIVVASSDLAVTCPESVYLAAARWFPIVALPAPLQLPIDRASIVWHEHAHEDPGLVWLRGRLDAFLKERRSPFEGRSGRRARRIGSSR
jgi:DNA-binding transcriptional LysR family regulator